eukprot:PITA_36388
MVAARAQAMANERMDKLEQTLQSIQNQLDDLAVLIPREMLKGKEEAHEEAYIGNGHSEGESSHCPHLWDTQKQQSHLRPPKLDMHKFDGSHPAPWIAQMEQYFNLNNILDNETQLMVGIMYLDNERWQWCEWHQRCNAPFSTWDKFKKALTYRFDQESSFLGRLTKLRQTGTVDGYIIAFEALAFHTRGLSNVFYTECFISGLKEAIKAHVQLHHPPTWIEACKIPHNMECALAALATRTNFTAKVRPTQAHSTTQTLKVQKVSPVEMAERRNSSEEDLPLEEPEAIEEDNQKDNVPDEPIISLHAMAGISSPQTLKIRGFIKHRPVVVLIDSGSTHNFIHKKFAEAVHCFVQEVSSFQVQIADGGIMKCEGRCENVKLQMWDYQLKTHMFAIHMGGCDIVLRAEWLHTLGPIAMDFQELYMSFKQNNSTHTLRGLQAGAPSIISSHGMEKLLKKGHHGVIAQFNAI